MNPEVLVFEGIGPMRTKIFIPKHRANITPKCGELPVFSHPRNVPWLLGAKIDCAKELANKSFIIILLEGDERNNPKFMAHI